MKLLFDENLSPRLSRSLVALFPDSVHVRDVGLERADDQEIWRYAREYGLVIVSKDADFHQMSFVLGDPPKVIWLRRGNCSTDEVEVLLRLRYRDLLAFEADVEASFLTVE